jgi:hypothetical protein
LATADEAGFHRGEWPFRPLERPAVPSVQNEAWVQTTVDRYILAELEKRGLQPSPRADKATLLRRVTFDLTGLPPTPEELTTFLNDHSPQAFERVVERLLASPRYGERWARHWLDLVRYADTAGFKRDYLRPDAFRYRDYVIGALNEDLPYDRFIQQQLAGDEMEPDNPAAIIATGMIRLYPEEATASDFVKLRQDILDDITEVTGFAFIGLTLGCAKCHDHKFDPITQADFFRWEACFSTIVPRDDVPAMAPQEREKYASQLQAWEAATSEIRQQIEELVEPVRKQAMQDLTVAYDADTKAAWLTPSEKRTTRQQQLWLLSRRQLTLLLAKRLKRMEGAAKTKYDDLQKQLAAWDHLKPQTPPTAMSVMDGAGPAPPVHILATGDYRKPLAEVTPGFPEFLGNPWQVSAELNPLSNPAVEAPSSSLTPPTPAPSSNRRRAELARWLTHPEHPLTARVMMNRVWQHHFGRGIVVTANDFGAMGAAPTHPLLLDWLAAEFVSQGWSLKAMHRLILKSAVYQQSSQVDLQLPAHAHAKKVDADNQYLWHFRRTRLQAEAVRDSLLAMAGRLELRMYGPSSYPELPDVVVENSSDAWEADPIEANRNRRSVYCIQKRNLRHPFLASFDQPDMYNSCAVRSNTLTATQSLSLWNSEITTEQARHWCGQLLAKTDDDNSFVQRAYMEIYSRLPNETELTAALGFIREQATSILESESGTPEDSLPLPMPHCLESNEAGARVDFCHALMNSSEFLFVD